MEALKDLAYDEQLEANHIVLKVRDGTPQSGRSLCFSCKNGLIIKGVNNELRVLCRRLDNKPVPFEVASCNEYYNRTHPYLSEMEEIAWMLVTKKVGRNIGFVDPKEWKRIKFQEDKEKE